MSDQGGDTRVPPGLGQVCSRPTELQGGKGEMEGCCARAQCPCSSLSLGCSQRRLEVDKAHLLQHMELGASCPQAAAGRARGAAPGAHGPCQSLPTSTRCRPLPGSVTASCLGRDVGTDPCWPRLLAPGDKDMAQPHSPGEGALSAVQDGARGLCDLKREERTF